MWAEVPNNPELKEGANSPIRGTAFSLTWVVQPEGWPVMQDSETLIATQRECLLQVPTVRRRHTPATFG